MVTAKLNLDDLRMDQALMSRDAQADDGGWEVTGSERRSRQARFRRRRSGGPRHDGVHRRRQKRNYL